MIVLGCFVGVCQWQTPKKTMMPHSQGSAPPLDHGLHRITLQAVFMVPLTKPKRLKDSLPYSEQVGVNLHPPLTKNDLRGP